MILPLPLVNTTTASLEVHQRGGVAVESKAFKRHVQEVLRPQPHNTEKYVIKRNWEAFDGSREPYSTNTDVVLLLQASPDRCALECQTHGILYNCSSFQTTY